MGELPRRERKKRATRAKLIDAAANLVVEQGYQNTTVQQIAEAVEVSPRTVAHYFPSKDGLLLAQVQAYAEAVVAELRRVPDEQGPLQALLTANCALLDGLAAQPTPVGAKRIATLLRSLHVSPAVQPLSGAVRIPGMYQQMAKRLGTTADDRRVELIFAVWAAIMGVAWSGVAEMYTGGDVDIAGLPAVLRQRLVDTCAEVASLSE